MNPTREVRYRCCECGEMHRTRDAAQDCCQPMVYEVATYVCTECGTVHDDEEKARYCCLDEDVVLPPAPAQLEAAGQQRLAL